MRQPHERLFSWIKSHFSPVPEIDVLVKLADDSETADKAIAKLGRMPAERQLELLRSSADLLSALSIRRPEWTLGFISDRTLLVQGELLAIPRVVRNFIFNGFLDKIDVLIDKQPKDTHDRIWLSRGALEALARYGDRKQGHNGCPDKAIEIISAMGSQEDRQQATIRSLYFLSSPDMGAQLNKLISSQPLETQKVIARSRDAIGLLADCGQLPLAIELMEGLTVAERSAALLQERTIERLVNAGGHRQTIRYVREQDLDIKVKIFKSSVRASYLMHLKDMEASALGLEVFLELPIEIQEKLREGYHHDALGRQMVGSTYKPIQIPSPQQVLDYIDNKSTLGSIEQARMLAAPDVALRLCRDGGLKSEVMERIRAQPADRRGALLATGTVAFALIDKETQPEILQWTFAQPLSMQADVARAFCFLEQINEFHSTDSSGIQLYDPALEFHMSPADTPAFMLLKKQPINVRYDILLTTGANSLFSVRELQALYEEGTPQAAAAMQAYKSGKSEGRIERHSIEWIHPSLVAKVDNPFLEESTQALPQVCVSRSLGPSP
jgi:hypothetical protein